MLACGLSVIYVSMPQPKLLNPAVPTVLKAYLYPQQLGIFTVSQWVFLPLPALCKPHTLDKLPIRIPDFI
jgi:hypothetical protein